MSVSASEDHSPVRVTSILSTDSALPPGLLLLVVLVSVVGLLFILLVVWYFLSGKAKQNAKLNLVEMEESFEGNIEVLREVGAGEFEQASLPYQDGGHLVVPRLNPSCSPSIFSGGLVMDNGLVNGGESEIVTATVHANANTGAVKSKTCRVACQMVSVDLDSPPDMELEEEHADKRDKDCLLVKDSTAYTSSLSLNVFLDCRDETQVGGHLQVPADVNSPNLSFRSAINSLRPKIRSPSTTSIMSISLVSPVYKIQFPDHDAASVVLQKKKDPLLDQESRATLSQSIEIGTEF